MRAAAAYGLCHGVVRVLGLATISWPAAAETRASSAFIA
jgi:hypothetical protein